MADHGNEAANAGSRPADAPDESSLDSDPSLELDGPPTRDQLTADDLSLSAAGEVNASQIPDSAMSFEVAGDGASDPAATADASVAPSSDSSDGDDDLQTQSHSDDGEQTIGRYVIKRLLGEGAFGKVFEAHDPMLNRLVAIKVAKSVAGKNQVKRFVREARAAARLRHPGIIPVYEYGRQEDGQNIIVYEFVRGETLRGLVQREGRLSVERAVHVVREIAEALDYAHEQEIIHRDIKPDNVMMDKKGKVHIADFGCARAEDDKTDLTVDGSILGTPMYMSPEQASGHSRTADGRTDIWSLGVIFYELLSGARPFNGSLSDILHWICHHDPPPLRKGAPDIPVDLETICNRCLQRDVRKRFSRAGEVADELERFLNGIPIQSRRTGPVERCVMWARRNPTVAMLASLVALVLLAGTSVSTLYAIRLKRESDRHVLTQIDLLRTSDADALPRIFQSLETLSNYDSIEQQLAKRDPQTDRQANELERLRSDLALMELAKDTYPVKRERLGEAIFGRLFIDHQMRPVDDASLLRVCRQSLLFWGRKANARVALWDIANSRSAEIGSQQRFQTAVALALYDPDSTRWPAIAPDVAGYLTSMEQIEMAPWLPLLTEARDPLAKPLLAIFQGQTRLAENSAVALAQLFKDQPQWLIDNVLPAATPEQAAHVLHALPKQMSVPLLREKLADERERPNPNLAYQSNLVAGLTQLDPQYDWKELATSEDPSLATAVIERLSPVSTSIETLLRKMNQLSESSDPADAPILAGVLLSIGQFQPSQITSEKGEHLAKSLAQIFKDHPHARVHCSARWLLTERLAQPHSWSAEEVLRREKKLARALPEPGKGWHIDKSLNTFAVFDAIGEYPFGLNKDESLMTQGFDYAGTYEEQQHYRSIPRRFGIGIHEVTIEQYEKFETALCHLYETQIKKAEARLDDENVNRPFYDQLNEDIKQIRKKQAARQRLATDRQRPVTEISFYQALAYCRWLSREAGIASELPTLSILAKLHHRGEHPEALQRIQQSVRTPGYRLPTAAEWESGCRGESRTLFPFGRELKMLDQYAWHATNANGTPKPVGQLKPGNFGIFDMLGNASEWCLDYYRPRLPELAPSQDKYEDFGAELASLTSRFREYRGGSYHDTWTKVRPTKRFNELPVQVKQLLGFRLARTYPAEW